jgi:tRNA threonylcarbamoyladenosine biosynthesis protein TsaE
MATSISHSPADTESLGETWGRQAQPGLVIGLSGDLGAGKTQLVKGIARGLGITERVHSPTFTLLNVYSGGRLPLYHIDLYRLETEEQILSAGLEEYLNPQGVTVIEWVERWFNEVPNGNKPGRSRLSQIRRVQIESINESQRRISYEDPVA